MLIHTVFFWLHDTVSHADRLVFERELAALLKSPCIERGHWGSPAAIPPRPVVDASYDYAITTVFKSLAEHDAYQTTDLVHKAFLTHCKQWWKQVKVYDFEAR